MLSKYIVLPMIVFASCQSVKPTANKEASGDSRSNGSCTQTIDGMQQCYEESEISAAFARDCKANNGDWSDSPCNKNLYSRMCQTIKTEIQEVSGTLHFTYYFKEGSSAVCDGNETPINH